MLSEEKNRTRLSRATPRCATRLRSRGDTHELFGLP